MKKGKERKSIHMEKPTYTLLDITSVLPSQTPSERLLYPSSQNTCDQFSIELGISRRGKYLPNGNPKTPHSPTDHLQDSAAS